jgi:hypothetical protein
MRFKHHRLRRLLFHDRVRALSYPDRHHDRLGVLLVHACHLLDHRDSPDP